GFLQIPPHDGHPCLLASGSYCQAHSGLTPPSYRTCRAHSKNRIGKIPNAAIKIAVINKLLVFLLEVLFF
ncbi:MAG: hypothetical protein LBI27_02670, partial [Clostridiales bacterium]|nr:hypothetical protein [Clostridiales bacterium]